MSFNPDIKRIAKWSMPAVALIAVIAIIFMVAGGPAGRKEKEKQKQLNNVFNFMTQEEEFKPENENIDRYEISREKIIQEIKLEKTTVCAGEDVMVTVTGRNPGGDDGNLVYRIGNIRGNPAILRFNRTGTREFYVVARNEGTGIDFKKVEIEVVDCPGKAFLVVDGKLASLKSEEAEFEVLKKSGIGNQCTYEWKFGDGSTAKSDHGFTTHNYALRDQKSFQSSFTITVTATDTEGRSATGRCSISFPNIHYFSSMMNDMIIPAQYDNFPAQKESLLEVPIAFKNIYSVDASFSGATIELKPCSAGQPQTTAVTIGSIMGATRLPAGETTKDLLRLDRSIFPAGTCNLVIKLTGELADNRPVSSTIYLNIVPTGPGGGDRDKKVSDREMIEKLEKAAKILGRDRPITPDDLKRLEKEGKL